MLPLALYLRDSNIISVTFANIISLFVKCLWQKAQFIYIVYHVKFEFLARVALKVFKTSGSTVLEQLIVLYPFDIQN